MPEKSKGLGFAISTCEKNEFDFQKMKIFSQFEKDVVVNVSFSCFGWKITS